MKELTARTFSEQYRVCEQPARRHLDSLVKKGMATGSPRGPGCSWLVSNVQGTGQPLPLCRGHRCTANRCYLEVLYPVEDPAQAQKSVQKLAVAVSYNGRSYRAFNRAAKRDVDLFAAVMPGKHTIMGFRNRDILLQLFATIKDSIILPRLSAKISRLLKLLHVHKLIAKIPRSRRWRVTLKGYSLMAMVLKIHHENYPRLLMNHAD
jgi:hypothetical protein